jgi:uncharacterized membrane protein YoaK (UPF0700 family)
MEAPFNDEDFFGMSMTEPSNNVIDTPAILLAMTFVTGIVDAVSILALGHVFTANMTGNIVFLGFGIGGAPVVSIQRSLLVLGCFMLGSLIGGRMTAGMAPKVSGPRVIRASVAEVALLVAAATIAIGMTAPYESHRFTVQAVAGTTALAMGLRNAVVRKLGVPDLTTTVLTLTITGLAADSALAGGDNVRWLRRLGSILAMLSGAVAGALLLNQSVALPLYVCAAITACCSFAWLHIESKGKQ